MKYITSGTQHNIKPHFHIKEEDAGSALLLISWLLSLWSSFIGALILAAGTDRMATVPAWKFVLFVPNGSTVVALGFLVLGIIMLCTLISRSARAMGLAAYGLAFWCIALATFFSAGSFTSSTGGVLGGPTWYVIGSIYFILGMLLRRR